MSRGTVTVRLIRSFEHRNIKHVVFQDVDFSMTAKSFIEFIQKEVATRSGIPLPFKKYVFDTLKISHTAHGAKSNDPVIDIENDHLILSEDQTLTSAGVKDETELSFFKMEDYRKYQENPHLVW